MSMPSKEQILEAAKTSKEAKQALRKLFPSYFEDEEYFDFSKCSHYTFFLGDNKPVGFYNTSIQIRRTGNLQNKGFFLSCDLNWKIVIDNKGQKVLVPTKKQ